MGDPIFFPSLRTAQIGRVLLGGFRAFPFRSHMLSSGGGLQIAMPMLSVHKLLTFLWADFTELMQTCWQIMVSQLVPVEHGFSHVRLMAIISIGNFIN